MNIQRLGLLAGLMLAGSAMAQAAIRVPTLLAVDVPEPTTAMLGAGGVLIALGLMRRRKAK